jgi:pyridoxine 5-phosphate synthase
MADRFHKAGIRVSIFVDPVVEMVTAAKECGADRVELYTEAYAAGYGEDREKAIAPYVAAAEEARREIVSEQLTETVPQLKKRR